MLGLQLLVFVAIMNLCSAKREILKDWAHSRPGKWSEWSPFICPKACDGAKTYQRRRCDNPTPSEFGIDCSGPFTQKSLCNTHPCGDSSWLEAQNIIHAINTIRRDVTTDTGSPVTINCEGKELYNIPTFPNATVSWIKDIRYNNFTWFDYNKTHLPFYEIYPELRALAALASYSGLITLDKWSARYEPWMEGIEVLKNGSLYLSVEHNEHAGLWLCVITPIAGKNSTIVSVSPVIVRPRWDKAIHKDVGDNLNLHCKAFFLSKLANTKNLTLKWFHNEKNYHVIKMAKPVEVDYLTVSNLTLSSAGTWTCYVTNEDTKFTFHTAYYEVVMHEKFFEQFKSRLWAAAVPSLLRIITAPTKVLDFMALGISFIYILRFSFNIIMLQQ